MIGMDIGNCNASTCMKDLFFQLATLVIVKQLLSNLAEVGVPWLKGKLTLLLRVRDLAKKELKQASNAIAELANLEGGDEQEEEKEKEKGKAIEHMTYFEEQCALPSPSPIFYEYNELMIQYGYMTMFATAFPLASLFALVNNILEIRVDALKIVFATKRPIQEGASDIGTWLSVLEFMSVIAVMTNAAIICFTSESLKGSIVDRTSSGYQQCALACQTELTRAAANYTKFLSNSSNPDFWLFAGYSQDHLHASADCFDACACTGRCWSLASRFLTFVIAEHILLALRIALDAFIPDVPMNIARALAWRDIVSDELNKELSLDSEAPHVIREWKLESDPEDTSKYFDTEEQSIKSKITVQASLRGVHLFTHDGVDLTKGDGRKSSLAMAGSYALEHNQE